MDMSKQPLMNQTARFLICAVVVPIFVLIGLLLNGMIAPNVNVTGEFAGWMVIFVMTIVLPMHLVTLVVTYLLAKNRFSFRRPLTTIFMSCILIALAIMLSKSSNPFSLVFSVTTVPLSLVSYVAAAGRMDTKPENSSKPTSLHDAP